MLAALVLIALWGSILLLPLYLLALSLPEGHGCPECAAPTLLLQSTLLRRLPGRFESRWCPRCGWEGAVRPETRHRWSLEVVEEPRAPERDRLPHDQPEQR